MPLNKIIRSSMRVLYKLPPRPIDTISTDHYSDLKRNEFE